MSYIPVIDSTILSTEIITAGDGRTYHLLELEYPEFTYEPGQFVMIQNQGDVFHWSYPYMIYENTARGLKVIAAEGSSLFSIGTSSKIAIWGANGTGCQPDGHAAFVAEPATLHLLLPLLHACAAPSLIVIGSKDSVPGEWIPADTRFVSDGANVVKLLTSVSDTVYMALNVPVLEDVMSNAKEAMKKQTLVFVSTRIGCGIGACKSCYLHSPDIHVGVPVCCNGPYLPYSKIDFEKDRKCFQTFR